jgi:AcrR family transcriptional regulator
MSPGVNSLGTHGTPFPIVRLTIPLRICIIVTDLVSHKIKKGDLAIPRTEEAKQRIREEQRAHILEAARRVFARKGLAATVDDVAAEAAVSHGLAYRYFANKEALFSELVVQALQEPSARLQSFLELPGTPGERLNSLVSAFVESRRHSEAYQLLDQVLSSEATPNDLRDVLQRRYQAVQDTLKRLIVEGQATGEVAEGDPDQLVRAILACIDGLTRWSVYDPEHYHEHFPDASIFLRMLKP